MPVRKTNLRELGERLLCPHCFTQMLATAEETMRGVALQLNEPDRVCSNCRAMVDPEVGSAWCSVLELGDDRATLCENFVSLKRHEAAIQILGHQARDTGHAEVWNLICSELENSLGSSQVGWLQNTNPTRLEGGVLHVDVLDEYTKSWLVARLMPAICQSLELNGYPDVSVEFRVAGDQSFTKSPDSPVINGSPAPSLILQPPPLVDRPKLAPLRAVMAGSFNPAFSFQNFVVGTGNRLAHAGAMSVAEGSPAYNPLYLHGVVGVGKTHLLQAIGGRCTADGAKQALYISSETFTNELITAIRGGSTSEFRQRYRHIDVLLVDDIHFIVGKESTQEEFFHTFNWLYDNGKQIVVSSDRAPHEMKILDERLRSRFSWGLMADIQPPDQETRVEILRRKALQRDRTIPDDVLAFLAGQTKHTVRELEGLLNKLLALADLYGVEPSLSLATGIASTRKGSREVGPNDILQAVTAYYRLTVSALSGPQRSRNVSTARHIAMYLMREDARLSLPQIGGMLGGRDHSTVIYACQRIAEQVAGEGQIKQDVEAVRGLLSSS